MKVTSIRLKNVRRFVEPVKIAGIGPGLNVLSAPNEAGKSTFFDALHAVFFARHRSWDKTIKTLQPRAGGDPEVTVTFDADGATWKLRKQWSRSAARKEAQLWRDGVLVGQSEEAEEKLAELIDAPADGGPAGLLWVQQGRVELDDGGEERQARLGIMESVAGEVEAMTGGQRMKAALKACEDFLGRHLTGTGKPKKGGGLADVTEQVEQLTDRRDALMAEVTALQEALDRRRRVQGELDELQDVDTVAGQQRRLREAEDRLKKAQEHAGQVELARSRLAEVQARRDGLLRQISQLSSAIREREAARLALSAAEVAYCDATRDLHAAQEARARLNAELTGAQQALDAASARARRAMQIEAAAAARAQRQELAGRIEKAEALRQEVEKLEAAIAQMLPDDTLQKLEEAASALHLAQRARDASAPAFVVTYADGTTARVLRKGEAVPENVAQPVPDGAELELEGIGRLRIMPGASGSDDSVAEAEQALARALEAAGVASLDEARAAARARRKAEDDLRGVRSDLSALAPDGIPALREQLARLPEPVEPDPDVPSREEAEAAERDARAARDAAAEALAAANATHETASERAAQSETAQAEARARVERADAALGGEDDPQVRLDALRHQQGKLSRALDEARETLARAEASAPDLDAAETAERRARSVVENTRKRVAQLREELAGLNAQIAASSGGAPEERLALVTEQLTDAETRKAALEFEIAVNRRLRDALQDALSTARNAYVEPVHRELVPLLRMLWPDAEPVLDAETGMISSISRRSVEEEFDILSGGTREQISLMVRLAFAHILAKRGRPAPVILDDAIVYTDDERIEQMFDALNRRADAVQIIVFSCRQRAFRALGGELLQIERAGEGAA